MRITRKFATALAGTVLIGGLLAGSPASADETAVCTLAGVVALSNTVLTNAGSGSGSFDSSLSSLTCVGTITGTASVGGAFSFCTHGDSGCPAGDGIVPSIVYDVVNGADPTNNVEPIAHVTGGPINTGTGLSHLGGGAAACSFSFQGHATVPAAELQVTGFECGGDAADLAFAEATFVPGLGPVSAALGGTNCGVDCFNRVLFVGVIEVVTV